MPDISVPFTPHIFSMYFRYMTIRSVIEREVYLSVMKIMLKINENVSSRIFFFYKFLHLAFVIPFDASLTSVILNIMKACNERYLFFAWNLLQSRSRLFFCEAAIRETRLARAKIVYIGETGDEAENSNDEQEYFFRNIRETYTSGNRTRR